MQSFSCSDIEDKLPSQACERFAWLGVYPDKTPINAFMTARLWDSVDILEAQNHLEYLASSQNGGKSEFAG